MAHPKSRISKARGAKRRTHYKLKTPSIAICPTTSQAHLPHRAFWHEGSLYYRGKVIMHNNKKDKVNEE